MGVDRRIRRGKLPAMRRLILVPAVLLALTACDKAEPKVADKAERAKPTAKAGDADKSDKADAADKVAAKAETSEDPEAGCIHDDKPAEHECEHADAPAGSTGHFGPEFALAGHKPLGEILAGVGDAPGSEPVGVTGTVDAVCQAKGCWMVLTDGDAKARVLIKDHAFALPMDGKGKVATVEGTLTIKELDEANVAHLRKDGDPNIEGPGKEFFLHATAVKIENS